MEMGLDCGGGAGVGLESGATGLTRSCMGSIG